MTLFNPLIENMKELQNWKRYRSDISLNEFNGKLYEDPFYGRPQPVVRLNYAIFSSKWEIEVLPDNELKIIHTDSSDSITLGFASLFDRLNFVENIYASRKVKQVNGGMNLEKRANQRIKPVPEKFPVFSFRLGLISSRNNTDES